MALAASLLKIKQRFESQSSGQFISNVMAGLELVFRKQLTMPKWVKKLI